MTPRLLSLRGLLAVVTLLAVCASPAQAARDGYPKVLNYFLSNSVTAQDISDLAQYDALVLDADFEIENPGAIATIRAANPDILIFGYIPANGALVSGGAADSTTVRRRHFDGLEQADFWLYSVDGTKAADWPGKWQTNLTPNAPLNALGETYPQWLARFVDEVIWQQGVWDGIAMDDVWDNISWLNASLDSPIDSDRDGFADVATQLDAWWMATNSDVMTEIRARLGNSVPLIGNGANTTYVPSNGTMIENFPYIGAADQGNPYGYAWQKWMFTSEGSYFNTMESYNDQPYRFMIVHTSWENGTAAAPDTTGRFHAHKRLTLASALLNDGWYAMDRTMELHDSMWWDAEYDHFLGDPVGPAYSYPLSGQTIWRRDFTNATVVVNANNAALTAQFGIPNIDGWDAYIGARIFDAPPADTIPPGEITTYWGWPLTDDSVLLKWWAVGDDAQSGRADHYLIRWDYQHIQDPAAWDAANDVPNTVVPSWPGVPETLSIGGLPQPDTDYYFAVRAVDDEGNTGPTSFFNFRIRTLEADPAAGDTIPPAAITSLVVDDYSYNWVTLEWNAPGDNGNEGVPLAYHGRYGTVPVTLGNWDSLTPISGFPTPSGGNALQQVTINALDPVTQYYFAVRAEDDAGNLGGLGAVPTVTTFPAPDLDGPAAVSDLAVTTLAETSLSLDFTAPADAVGTVTAYEIRYVAGSNFPDAAWSSATPVAPPLPASPGTQQSFSVGGLAAESTYTVRMLARDDSGNDSDLSNSAMGTTTDGNPPPPPPDVTGPHPVDDIALLGAAQTTLDLTFSAPLDDEGTVMTYDLRYVVGTVFDLADWATATPVPTGTPAAPGAVESVGVTGLDPATTYCFRILSRDDSDNDSALSSPFEATTDSPPPPPDTEGPAPVDDLAMTGSGETWLSFQFTAPADALGSVTAYEVRYVSGTSFPDGVWDAATPATPPAVQTPGLTVASTLTGLTASSSYTVRVRAKDSADNWSALSNASTGITNDPPPPPPADTTGPAVITDLAPSSMGETWINLQFTAPADAEGTVTEYDIRFVTGDTFADESWDGATVLTAPSPINPGLTVALQASGLSASTTYAFRARSKDDAANWSALGNTAAVTTTDPPPPADITGPAAVTDLAVTDTGEGWISLAFTAPADSEGEVTDYLLRYVEGATFGAGAWAGATPVSAGTPQSPGSTETVLVDGLDPSTSYSFRLLSQDDADNDSDLSNVATGTTDSPPPPPDTTGPLAIADLVVIASGETWLTVQFTAPSDAEGSVASYDLRAVSGAVFGDDLLDGATAVATDPPGLPGAIEVVTWSDLSPSSEYAFRIRSFDDSGNAAVWSAAAVGATDDPPPPPPEDTEPPAPVLDLALSVDDQTGEVTLLWTAPTDEDSGKASAYDLRWRLDALDGSTWDGATAVDGEPVPAVGGTTQSLMLDLWGLPEVGVVTVAFGLTSVDSAGNVSALSNTALAELEALELPPDTMAPSAVTDLSGEVAATQVQLLWSPSPEPDVSHYRIYRARFPGRASVLYREHVSSPDFLDPSVAPGREYAYRVTAMDVSGNESPLSPEVRVVVPSMPDIMRPIDFFSVGVATPNPAPGPVTLTVGLGSADKVTLDVFDVRGRRLRRLSDVRLGAGDESVTWDGRDEAGRRVARGMYWVRVSSSHGQLVRKVMVIRK